MDKIETDLKISVTDMHTGGEPLRIVTAGYPPIEGKTLLEKRAYAKKHLDEYRQVVMFEPRGHNDLYGAILVEPDLPEADIGIVFIHNEGYGTMCGHAVIALGRYIVDNNLLKNKQVVENGVVATNMQCPCGLVKADVEVNNGQSGRVSFVSVPAFLYKQDVKINLPLYGDITLDLSYGGTFYAIVDINQTDLDLSKTPVGKLNEFGTAVSNYVRQNMELKHPFEEGISFLFGTILTDGADDKEISKNLTIFADSEVDRSPCGSGVTARMAAQFAKGQAKLNQKKKIVNSKTGSEFTSEVVEKTTFGQYDAVRIKVGGEAFYTGTATFIREPKDPMRNGFLVK